MGGGDSFRETLARAKHGKQRRQTAKTVSSCAGLVLGGNCCNYNTVGGYQTDPLFPCVWRAFRLFSVFGGVDPKVTGGSKRFGACQFEMAQYYIKERPRPRD